MAEFENTNNMSGDQIDRALSDLIQKGDRAFDKFNRIMDNELNKQTQSAEQRAQRQAYADVRRQEAQIKKETGFSRETFIRASNGDEDEAQKMVEMARSKKQERELARLNKMRGIDDSSMKRAEAKQKAVSAETKELQNMGAMLGKVTRLLNIFGLALGAKAFMKTAGEHTAETTSGAQAGLSREAVRAYKQVAKSYKITPDAHIKGSAHMSEIYGDYERGIIYEPLKQLIGFMSADGLKVPTFDDFSKLNSDEFYQELIKSLENAIEQGLNGEPLEKYKGLYNQLLGTEVVNSIITGMNHNMPVSKAIDEAMLAVNSPDDYTKNVLELNTEWQTTLTNIQNILDRLYNLFVPMVTGFLNFLNKLGFLASADRVGLDLERAYKSGGVDGLHKVIDKQLNATKGLDLKVSKDNGFKNPELITDIIKLKMYALNNPNTKASDFAEKYIPKLLEKLSAEDYTNFMNMKMYDLKFEKGKNLFDVATKGVSEYRYLMGALGASFLQGDAFTLGAFTELDSKNNQNNKQDDPPILFDNQVSNNQTNKSARKEDEAQNKQFSIDLLYLDKSQEQKASQLELQEHGALNMNGAMPLDYLAYTNQGLANVTLNIIDKTREGVEFKADFNDGFVKINDDYNYSMG